MFRDCKLWGPQLVMVLHDNSSFANVLYILRKYLLLFWTWFCEIFLVGFFWASCTVLRLFVWRFLWWHFTLWDWTALILELFRTMVRVVNFISEVFFFYYLTFRIKGKKYFPPSMFGVVHNSPPYLWNQPISPSMFGKWANTPNPLLFQLNSVKSYGIFSRSY